MLVKNENIDNLVISETKVDSKVDDKLIALKDFSLFRVELIEVGKVVVLLSLSEMGSCSKLVS